MPQKEQARSQILERGNIYFGYTYLGKGSVGGRKHPMAFVLLTFRASVQKEGVEPMKELRQVTRFAVLGLMLSGLFAGSMFAQAQQGSDDKNRRDRVANETTMTGCLTKDTGSNYTLTDEKTGVKTTVTGASDLEKHSSNHKVKLTGVTKTDASGNQVFEVTSIEHVSASCKAPSQ